MLHSDIPVRQDDNGIQIILIVPVRQHDNGIHIILIYRESS